MGRPISKRTSLFDSQHCSNCPFQETCPVKQGKKYHYLRYTDKEMRLAKRRAYEQIEEFKDRYRWWAGVEGTMSEYDRKTGVKHLRVRGLKAVRFCATLKAIGVNILRATAVQRAINGDRTAHQSSIRSNACHFCYQRACSYGYEPSEKYFYPIYPLLSIYFHHSCVSEF